MKKTIQKGFTLIELLVVIAIIGILSGILFIAINPAEQSAKADAVRIANDIKNIEKAFQLTALDDLSKPLYQTPQILGSSTNNIPLKTIIQNGDLKYLASDDIDAEDIVSGGYKYCNVFGSFYICGYPTSSGSRDKILSELDRIFDGSDGLTWGSGRLSLYGS
jgi:prepilin-type N-terminal cleavage/methylation domain-containing protein